MATVVSDEREKPPGQLEVDAELVENISTLIEANQQGMVMNLVADLFPADLSSLLTHLPFDQAMQLFQWLPIEDASEVIAELESGFRTALLEQVKPARLTALLDELDTDDAADVLSELPDDLAQHVLPHLEDAADVEELLGYAEDTAGGIMGTEFVSVHAQWTVADATEEVRRNAERIGEIYGVFVVDEHDHLEGIVSLKRLLLSPSHASVESIMERDIVSVQTHLDQEEVARLMQRYDMVSMPVVDIHGRLVGRITIDDVVDVIREEAEEDMQRMSGVSGDEGLTDSVVRIVRGRLPWLLIGLVGAALSGVVIGVFDSVLEEAVILATFIPIVTAMAGNAGIQSSAIVVQGLASGEVWSTDVVRRLGKELAVGLFNGTILALLLAAAVVVLPELLHMLGIMPTVFVDVHLINLALAAGLSLLLVILLATCIGTAVPILLHRVEIDPALATGPFITTSNDILGLGVYFIVMTTIYF